MGEIYVCDKCEKVIKDGEKIRFSIGGDKLFNEYGFSKSFYLCKKCSEPLAKYIKKFLKIKKNK